MTGGAVDLAAPVRRGALERLRTLPIEQRTALVVAIPYLVGLLAVTLLPKSELVGGASNLVPFRSIQALAFDSASPTIAFRQLIGNSVLLVPLGLCLGVFRLRWHRALAALVAASMAIELAQILIVPGRIADVDDVILNTGGGLMGVGVGAAFVACCASLRDGAVRRFA